MPGPPKALVFDVFGTVVDWRTSVIASGQELSQRLGLDVDWGAFANDWRREGYLTPIIETVLGRREWAPVDELLRGNLVVLLDRYGIRGLMEPDFSHLLGVWHRLTPWPDAVDGLTRLKKRYPIGPLSNGGFALLTEMAKAAGLPWDFIISAEFFRDYKPSPAVYLGAARMLERAPGEMMLVAAHPDDLDAARAVGFQTGYVPRPTERGPDAHWERDADASRFDVVAEDLEGLADQLGA